MLQATAIMMKNEMKKKLSDLFHHWDNDSSGFVSLEFLECTLNMFKPTHLTDAISEGILFIHAM